MKNAANHLCLQTSDVMIMTRKKNQVFALYVLLRFTKTRNSDHRLCTQFVAPFPATFAYKYLTFLPEQNKYLNDFGANFGISVMFHKSKSKSKTPENFIFNLLITLSFPLWYHIFTVR